MSFSLRTLYALLCLLMLANTQVFAIDINIKTLTGGEVELKLPEGSKVSDLKAAISATNPQSLKLDGRVTVAQQRLVFAGRELGDSETLKKERHEGNTIFLVLLRSSITHSHIEEELNPSNPTLVPNEDGLIKTKNPSHTPEKEEESTRIGYVGFSMALAAMFTLLLIGFTSENQAPTPTEEGSV